MEKIFEKHETLFCMLLIILYLVVNSYCMQNFGLTDFRSAVINFVFSIILIVFMILLKRLKFYGITKPENSKKFLYFFPLVIIASVNLWGGINLEYSKEEIVFHILTMINVGFLEEIIFRGFLFKMMEKDNPRLAIWVSAITFGIGHIINLLNGSEVIETLVQICYAIAAGYVFVIIFYKSKSLVPCIITHALLNSLSIFLVENFVTIYIVPAVLIIIPISYSIYINKFVKIESENK